MEYLVRIGASQSAVAAARGRGNVTRGVVSVTGDAIEPNAARYSFAEIDVDTHEGSGDEFRGA